MSEWEMVKLSDLFDLQMGKTPSRNNSLFWRDGTNPWVSISDISKSGKHICETKEMITDIGVKESRIKVVPKDTVIMSFKLSLGKTSITAKDLYTNEAIMAFHDKKFRKLDNNYIYYLFSNRDWGIETNKAVKGMTLNKANLSNVNIPIPPINIQKQIASILDSATEHISLRKQQLEEVDYLIKSQFIEMFGDPATNPMNHKITTLGEICSSISDGTHKTPVYLEDGIPFVSAKNIKHGKLDFSDIKYISEDEYTAIQKRCKTEKGDILLSKSGTLGVPAMVEVDYPFGIFESLAVIKTQKDLVENKYLCEHLKGDFIQSQFKTGTKGIAIKHLHLNVLKAVRVLLPSLSLQNRFADFVRAADKSKFYIQKSVEESQLLFDSLMSQYFE